MTEYIGSSQESDDDDDSESPEESVAPASSFGELLLRDDSAETEETQTKHETIWDRLGRSDDEERPSLLSLAEKGTEETAEDEDDHVPAEEEAKAETGDPATDHEELETEDQLAALEPEEEKLVIKDDSANHRPELEAEKAQTAPGSAEYEALEAAEKFHDKLQAKLEDPDKPAHDAVEEAFAETRQELAVEEVSDEAAGDEVPVGETMPPAAPELVPPAAEANEDEPEDATATAVPASPPPPTGPTAGSAAAYGGFGGTGPGFGRSAATPVRAASHELTSSDGIDAEREGENRGLVVGSILGYLIGKRRGRIKTEKRLLPVQEKLEKKVKQLHDEVADKEQQIRSLVAQKVRAAAASRLEAVVEQTKSQPPAAGQAKPLIRPIQPEITANQPTAETGLPLAERSAVAPVSVTAEQAPGGTGPESRPAMPRLEHVEQMNRAELLEASSKVIIDGTSLRTIFEARQITERGVRHILTEFLAGGDIKQALSEELLVKQLTYERDPHMRDQLSAGYGNPPSTAGAATGTAPAPAGIVNDQLSAAQGRQLLENSLQQTAQPHERRDSFDEAEHAAQRLERLIVGTWFTVIIVLVTVAVIIFAFKH